MNQRALLGNGWARGGSSEVVRRAHPASGAQWNVQVVRGKVNGRCLWNACKALSLGLLLMVLGAAMATIGYYADHLSVAQEMRGNATVKVKNESRGFHLNNLSYAGPMVMGVGGFIVVAACVMTFEARDSAAKVVPARFKPNSTAPPPKLCAARAPYGSLRTAGSQTHGAPPPPTDRRALTRSFVHFSKGLAIDQARSCQLDVPQASINRSPSAPDLASERFGGAERPFVACEKDAKENKAENKPRGCALLNPGLLRRHALSVDETGGNFRSSTESLQRTLAGSQGSMAMDLHLDCPVTLRVRDKRRNPPLKRQRKVEEDGNQIDDEARRSSHSCSPRMPSHGLKEQTTPKGGSAQQLPTHYPVQVTSKRRSSNASDCTHRSRTRRRDGHRHSRGRLERAISSDSRLAGAAPRHPSHLNRRPATAQNSTEHDPIGCGSDTDVRHTIVQFSPQKLG